MVPAGAHGARERDAAPEQRAAMDQAIAGDDFERGGVPSALRIDHDDLPGAGCLSHPAYPDSSLC